MVDPGFIAKETEIYPGFFGKDESRIYNPKLFARNTCHRLIDMFYDTVDG